MHSRRAHVRKQLRGAATLAMVGNTRDARMWDLGVEGAAVTTVRPVAPGTRCKLSFAIPLAGSFVDVTVDAKTVYCSYIGGADGFRVGMMFGPLDTGTAEALARFSEG
jgi:hypothetical protein